MPQITARDTATGKTVTFNWNGDGKPTDADMAEVFKAAQGGDYKPSRPPLLGPQPMGSHGGTEPEGGGQGLMAGLLQRMEPMAHPQGLGDFASALLPATGFGTGLGALRGWGTAAKNLFQGAAEGAANREGLKKLPAAFQGMKNVAMDAVSGRDRAFQEAPLSQQMESLPTRGAMPTGRPNAPPLRSETPFHELPLYQQMEQMGSAPSGGGSLRSGSAIPNLGRETSSTGLAADVEKARAAAAGSNPLSPEAQSRLLKQLQMSKLVKIGPET